MFASGENLQDAHLPALIGLAFPPLLAIVNADPSNGGKAFSGRVKMRAVMVLQSCVDWYAFRAEISGNSSSSMSKVMGPALSAWLDTFQMILATPDSPTQFQGLKITVLKVSMLHSNSQ